MLGFVIATGATVAKEAVYAAEVGELPPAKPLTADQRKFQEGLLQAGLVKEVPTHTQPERRVKLKKLSEADARRLNAEFGGSVGTLPLPTEVLKNPGPRYPIDLLRARKSGRAVCYFEVLPDGSVGRIYGGETNSEDFLKACARALKDWKFAVAEKPRFMRLPFEANYKDP